MDFDEKQKYKPKSNTKKILIFLVILFLSPVLILPLWYFAYSGFNISPFLPQDAMALSYLEKRYGQEFQIIRSRSGDSLGSSINYRKVAAPKSDFSQEFNIYKCLARCSTGDSSEYTDSYPSAVYDSELTKDVQNRTVDFGLTDKASISIGVWVKNYKKTDVDIFKPGSKELLSVMDLPRKYDEQRNGIGFSVGIKTTKENPTQEDFERYATSIAHIRDYYWEKGMSTTFTYTIDTGEEAEDSNSKYYRYYVYTYKTDSYEKREEQSAKSISTQFVKEKQTKRVE